MGGLDLGRISGIGIRIDWSLLIIFVLIAGTLAAGVFPAWHPDWSVARSWLTALAAAVLFFGSVLLHELSHALVGRRHGIVVRRITLFVFGGIAQMESEPRQWRAELWMAVVGPLTSLVLGFACMWIGALLATPGIPLDPRHPQLWLAALGPWPTLFLWLGQINIVLALFNLVPGFPLDGGRVLRALFWGATGNLRTATRWASAAGQVFAWVLITAGFAMILGLRLPFFGTGLVGGLWLAFIGWFLNNAAQQSYRQLVVQETLRDLLVSSVMQTHVQNVPPELPLAQFVDECLLRGPQQSYPVVDHDRLLGLVGFAEVRGLDRSAWQQRSVGEVMTPLAKLRTVSPRDHALEVLSAVRGSEQIRLPVVEQGRLRGLLQLEDIPRWLALHGWPGPGSPADHHLFAR
ncbi:MAG TPA: site-2 protease family protein [Steroidobacteraceae bacterium]|nr:site-2 protease family protein [Steroidobacteraceae bacterium]